MYGISFASAQHISPPNPNRMDIACFVGFVPLRDGCEIPDSLRIWLEENRWLDRLKQQPSGLYDLVDVPIPVESWEAFQELFAGEKRLDGRAEVCSFTLGEEILISGDDTLFHVTVDGITGQIELPCGRRKLDDIAAIINTVINQDFNPAGIGAKARVDTIGNDKYLVITHAVEGKAGQISVYANPSLGFSRAASASNNYIDTYLSSTVRSFFVQGGRKCYVIRMADPLPLNAGESDRICRIAQLLWGDDTIWGKGLKLEQLINACFPPMATPAEPNESWHGIELLLGLPEVTYVSFPDLPDLLAAPLEQLTDVVPKRSKEIFVECSSCLAQERQLSTAHWDIPRCNNKGYAVWNKIIRYLLDFINRHRRETQLLASLPIPDSEMGKDFNSFVYKDLLAGDDNGVETTTLHTQLQLTFPWVKTLAATQLPGGAELPEGILAGILAGNALSRGAYRSAAGTYVQQAFDLVPSQMEWKESKPDLSHRSQQDLSLSERISVFYFRPRGLQLYSDVTASIDPFYRYGAVRRLFMFILRAACNRGWSTVFEPLSSATWQNVETHLSSLFRMVYEAGGLRGRTYKEAFTVACNRSTMTQNDLDNGRLIANISFQPSVPIEQINLMLTLDDGGQVAIRRADS